MAKHLQNKTKGKSNSLLLVVLLVILLGGIGFSGYKLGSTLLEYHRADVEYRNASAAFTVEQGETATEDTERSERIQQAIEELVEEDEPIFLTVNKDWGYTVNFDSLRAVNSDVVGWINSTGTVIDYPVLYAATNDTYIHTTLYGAYNGAGSIFTSYRCRGDLSDYKTIIYGHHMKSGSMFASLVKYKNQSYYEQHPYIWYVTPQADYVLYVVAGYVVSAYDDAYDSLYSEDEVRDFLSIARASSNFTADYVMDGLDADAIVSSARRCVVLSTCTYEYEDARYIVVAVPLLAVPE